MEAGSEEAWAAHSAHAFRWYFRTHILIASLLLVFETAFMLFASSKPPSLFDVANPVLDAGCIFGRVMVHRWSDHCLAHRIAARLWLGAWLVFSVLCVHDLSIHLDVDTCIWPSFGWLSHQDETIGRVSRSVSSVETAMVLCCVVCGFVHWTMQMPHVHFELTLALFLLPTLLLAIFAHQCHNLLRVMVTCDASFLFGMLLGHAYALPLPSESFNEQCEK